MTKFKVGDRVVILKNIRQEEFDRFGNEKYYIDKAKRLKYLTIKTYFTEDKTYFTEEGHLAFNEIPQWWMVKWFIKFNTQLELNFEGEENGR